MADQLIALLRDHVIAAFTGPPRKEQLAVIGQQLTQLEERMAKLQTENAWLRERRYRALLEESGSVTERDLVRNHILLSVPGGGDGHGLRVNCPLCHRQASSMEGIFNYSCSRCRWVADFSREDLEMTMKESF